MISDEDCLITGRRFGKIILSYRQGQKGAGTDENFTSCPGVNQWAGKLVLVADHGPVMALSQAVYCRHTPYDANQYHEQPHEQGSTCCKLSSSTSKRVAALDPDSRISLPIEYLPESSENSDDDDSLDEVFVAPESSESSDDDDRPAEVFVVGSHAEGIASSLGERGKEAEAAGAKLHQPKERLTIVLPSKDMICSYAAANAAALPTSESKRDKKRRRNGAARNVSREERNMMAITPQIDKMEQKEEDAKAASRQK